MAAGVLRLLRLFLLTIALVTAEHTPIIKVSTTPWVTVSTQSSTRLVMSCVCGGGNLLCAIEATNRGTSNSFVIPGSAHYVRIQQPQLYLQLNRKVRPRLSPAHRPVAEEQRESERNQGSERFIYTCSVATNYRKNSELKMKCEKTNVIWNEEDVKWYEKLSVSCDNICAEVIFDSPFKMKLINAVRFVRTACVLASKLRRENPIISKNRRHVRAVATMSSSQTLSTSTITKDPINTSAQTTASQKPLQTTPTAAATSRTQPETTSQVKVVETETEPASQATMTTVKITVESRSTPLGSLPSSHSVPVSMSSSYIFASPTREPGTASDSLRSDPITYVESSVTPDPNPKKAVGNTTHEVPLNSTSAPVTSNNATKHNDAQPAMQEIDVNELRSLLVLAAVTRLASRPTVWGAFIGLFFGCILFVIVVFVTCAKTKASSTQSNNSRSFETMGLTTTLSSSVPPFPDSDASSSRESGYTSCNGSSDSHQNELCSSNPSVHSHSINSRSNTIRSDGPRDMNAARPDTIARSISNPVPYYGETSMGTGAPIAASAMSFENIIAAMSSQAKDKSVSLTITCNSLPRSKKQSARVKESIAMKRSNPTDRATSLRRGMPLNGNVDEEGYSHVIVADCENGRYLTIDEDSDRCSTSSAPNSHHEYDNFCEDNGNSPPMTPPRITSPISIEGNNYVNVEECFERSDQRRCSWV